MPDNRLHQHPILNLVRGEKIEFFWNGLRLFGFDNETIASALIANNIHIFGQHHKDQSHQGIFCANGQCAQCMVIVNGKPVKACTEKLTSGLDIKPLYSLPTITPTTQNITNFEPIKEVSTPVLIIGGGPAGLSSAFTLSEYGIDSILVDDKQKLGGKLILQTHRFFGSSKAVFAGMRGIDIAKKLEKSVCESCHVEVWNDSSAVAVFHDQKIGVLFQNNEYRLISPGVCIMACGAREKSLIFPGNTLPGVIGAGAFQTLLNRDLVKPANRIIVVGGGNVGLITAYHAVQAGIEVAALVEILPECGGYKVHRDKLSRLGVPILNSHTLLKAEGGSRVESALIARVDDHFQPIQHDQFRIDCDMILIAVGLTPIDELTHQAKKFGMTVFSAGDSHHIAEASAAMLSGQLCGHQVARHLGEKVTVNEDQLREIQLILESKPGIVISKSHSRYNRKVYPAIHCTQEIPCDPCEKVCPIHLIKLENHDIRAVPILDPLGKECTACLKCVVNCPGLAITLVDKRSDINHPLINVPIELNLSSQIIGAQMQAVDCKGEVLTNVTIENILTRKADGRTQILQFHIPSIFANDVAGIRFFQSILPERINRYISSIPEDAIICRCERVTAGEIRSHISKGIVDLNELKTISRAGMGACGGKTCQPHIIQLLKEAGIEDTQITPITPRPLFLEVPLRILSGQKTENIKRCMRE